MGEEDHDRRSILTKRLLGILQSHGYQTWNPFDGEVSGDCQTEVTLSYLEIAEIAAALQDATWMPSDLEHLHQFRLFWARLHDASPDERSRLLRDAGLDRSGQKVRTLSRRLNMARHYCELTRRGRVRSPEREAIHDHLTPKGRLFGEVTRGFFESASSRYTGLPGAAEPPPQPGEMVWERVSNVEAIRIIARWYGCSDDVAALGQLIEARQALKANANHPLVYRQFPPPYDWFELPNESKLYTR